MTYDRDSPRSRRPEHRGDRTFRRRLVHNLGTESHGSHYCGHPRLVTKDEMYAALQLRAHGFGGFVTLGQAADAGLTESEMSTLVRRGAWLKVAPGLRRIVGCGADDDDWRNRVRAAMLRAGPGAVAAGHTAARLLDIAGSPPTGAIWVAVPPNRHPDKRPGVRVMRTAVPAKDIVDVDGIAATGALRAVLDSARYADQRPAVCLIESAVRQDVLAMASVRSAIAAIRGKRGSLRAETALERVDLRSESPLETKARLLLVDAGFPYPHLQQPVAAGDDRRIDLAYLAPSGSAYAGVAIEIDGRDVHARAEAFHRDPVRQTAMEEANWLVRRFTSRHLYDIAYVVRTVRRALERVGYRDE